MIPGEEVRRLQAKRSIIPIGFLEGESTERVEKRFIGNFSIPFSTLLMEKRIEGTFRYPGRFFAMGKYVAG